METSPRSSRLGILRESQFRLLWIGQTASLAGDAVLEIAVAFAVLEIGGSVADLGIVFAAYITAHVALVLAGGVWADRLPRQRVMVACDVIRAVVEVGMGILLVSGTAEVWQLALAAALVGGAGAFFVPASTGLIPQLVSPARLQQANAMLSLSRTSTRIVGPAVAGLLIALTSTGVVFLVDAATFVVSAVSLLLLRAVPAPARDSKGPTFKDDLVAGWREVASRRWLWASLLAFGVGNMAATFAYVLGPVIALERLGGAAVWGLVVTGTGVGGVVGGIVALRLRPARPLRAAFLIVSLTALPALALAGSLPALIVAGGMAGSALGIELTNAWWFTLLQEEIPTESLSRVSSYDWLVSLVFQPTGLLLAGPIALALGTDPTLLLSAGIIAVEVVLVLLVREVRDHRWPTSVADQAGSA
jgi:MFS family permease